MVTQLPEGVRLLRTLTGHDGTIGRIAWSPYGRLLATPSADGTIRIWDADSGVCLRTIRHHGRVFASAFDPDGRILATGGDDGTELWDVQSWELRTTLDSGACNAVAFSPRNRILATANDVSGVTLWKPSTGAVLHRLIGHGVVLVAFDAEGGMLATGSAIPAWCNLSRVPVMAGCSRRRVGMAPYGSGSPKADGAGQSCLRPLPKIGCPASRSTRICRSWRRSDRTPSPRP